MANNKMLIDATHPEETRVVVLRNGRVEEFDYESAARKLLRGSIYLAKVTRVEPSLQAAFIDYGGNRHGFLAFNEIHPDYYQIPFADRQALLDEEAEQEAREEAEADARAERLEKRMRQQQQGGRTRSGGSGRGMRGDDDGSGQQSAGFQSNADDQPEFVGENSGDAGATDRDADADEVNVSLALDNDRRDDKISEPVTIGGFEGDTSTNISDVASDDDDDDHNDQVEVLEAGDGDTSDHDAEADDSEHDDDDRHQDQFEANASQNEPIESDDAAGEAPSAELTVAQQPAEAVEQGGQEDAAEELPVRQRRRPRSYKIQEVIKRRQIILVQVVKEERGTKGAALTTYLSLAGRYTVLMPNTGRGGGISRKITQPQDRKRLKAIANELEVPEGMGLIIRTAGAARTKQEIKRDFEYLLRLWESVRELTLESTAPSLVYEEGDLIKRSIRDLYNKDVEEIFVAGDQAHKDAHDFMQMLMPSHAKNVIKHQGHESLFTKHGIEKQLSAMFSPFVTLRSGGYLVINQTEALVAIDVNSGKSTREFSIEETALNTNLEAADEVARQVKLRDLAGLIVIDFIDMEEKRNNRAVERRIKDALRFDRARIQLGHISHFGLLEMSRQRMRTGVLEGSTTQCPHCQGTGTIRATESVALAVLRGLEDAVMGGGRTAMTVTTTTPVALYILNSKRAFINELEARYGVSLTILASDKLQGANYTIERGAAMASAPVQQQQQHRVERSAVNMDWGFDGDADEAPAAEAVGEPEVISSENDTGDFRPQQRREGRGGRDRDGRGFRDNRDRNDRNDRGDRVDRGEASDVREARDDSGDGSGDGGRDGQGRRNRRRRGGRGRDGDRGQNGFRGDRDRNPRPDTRVFKPGEDQPDLNGTAAPIADVDGEPAVAPNEHQGTQGQAPNDQRGDNDRGRRRRRGRRGGRGGRDRGERGPGFEGEGSQADASGETTGFHPHVGEQPVDDFTSAVMEGDTPAAMPDQPRADRAPREQRPFRERDRNAGRGRDQGANRHERHERGDRPRRDDAPVVTSPSEQPTFQPTFQAEPVAAPIHVPEHRVPEPVATAPEPEAPRRRARSADLTSSEPVIESVVVRPGETAAATDAPAAPKRGWWQRTIGG